MSIGLGDTKDQNVGVVERQRGYDGIAAQQLPDHNTRIAEHVQLASFSGSRLLPEPHGNPLKPDSQGPLND
ncbi:MULTISPECIES: hypothetical protein [Pseudomonas]|uniref:hypothetical protein n=1 Tax=Pseudomonas TaxID=286 RepID=UPI000ACED30B|nr:MULTISPECIES: hypothetical protein [unclassified Pseudomonas]MBW8129672.1 hypothetical protein [Pseudomonas sp. LAP_36]MBW8138625.1 hypothetical protein [Pseudomonas sp. PAMC 26818]